MMTREKAIARIRAFNRFYTNILGVIDRHILESAYSLTEARVLFEIHHDTGITARRLKKLLTVDEGYLSHVLDKLRKEGLIERTRSKDDGRLFALALTAKGEAEFLTLNDRSDRAIAALVGRFADQGLEELIDHMAGIEERLRSTEEADDRGG